MRRSSQIIALVGLALLLAWPARAEFPPKAGDFQVSGSAGYIAFKPYGSDAQAWQGADVAGGLTYSLHEMLAVTGNLEHGFALRPEDGGRTIARVQGQLRVYPPRGQSSKSRISLAAGPGWIDKVPLLNTQIAVSHEVGPHLSAFGVFAHGFAYNATEHDQDFFRLGVNLGTALGR